MSAELIFPAAIAGVASGLSTLYAVLRSGASYVNASTGALIAATDANWAAAAIALSDSASAGEYVASMPSATPAGAYSYSVWMQVGSSPIKTGSTPDLPVGFDGHADWSGTASVTLAAVLAASREAESITTEVE